jgi:phosphomethylpyrimidine synthase
MESAKRGVATTEMKKLAKKEKVNIDMIKRRVANGKVVIMEKEGEVCGIGTGLRTKVNANLGTSPDLCKVKDELKKVDIAIDAGADTVMDLSVSGNLDEILKSVIKNSTVPVGTVPIYSAFSKRLQRGVEFGSLPSEDMLKAIEQHIKIGVNFMTIHAAMTMKGVKLALNRVLKIVSRGGGLIAHWMIKNNKENPLYENFDYIVEMCKEKDVIISLGDALRPGALGDADDKAQIHELVTQGKLVKLAHAKNVGVICEGPGHMPLNKIVENVKLQKKLCHGVPYYVLGPLVTDIGVGYDHINAAIGGAIAASVGVDWLCAVTPSEHVSLPDSQDIFEGVVAAKIAAHSADIAKGLENERDLEMSKARAALDWNRMFKLALHGRKAREYRKIRSSKSKGCSICGKYCPIMLLNSV